MNTSTQKTNVLEYEYDYLLNHVVFSLIGQVGHDTWSDSARLELILIGD